MITKPGDHAVIFTGTVVAMILSHTRFPSGMPNLAVVCRTSLLSGLPENVSAANPETITLFLGAEKCKLATVDNRIEALMQFGSSQPMISIPFESIVTIADRDTGMSVTHPFVLARPITPPDKSSRPSTQSPEPPPLAVKTESNVLSFPKRAS